MAIFGSIARDEAREGSNLDMLIEFQEGWATFAHYMDLKFYLADLFGTNVDLVTERVVRPALHPNVERDASAVA